MVPVDGKIDAELLAKSVLGNPSAFIALVRRYEGPLAAMIHRWVEDSHHAEDVLQETLLQAWRSLGQLKKPDHLKAWLKAYVHRLQGSCLCRNPRSWIANSHGLVRSTRMDLDQRV